MLHCFNAEIAEKYGVTEAILLQNIYYWVCRNKKDDRNLHDGRYWTYNSIASYIKMFPYLTEHKIRSAFKKLKDEGMIITANYNTSPFNKTIWYTTTEKAEAILNADTEKMSNRIDNIVKSNAEKTENGNGEFNKSSITNINTRYKRQINDTHNDKERLLSNFEKFWSAYPNKERKAEAQEVFLKINPDKDTFEKMIKTINTFASSERWQADNGRYIPFAVNWLKQKRWNDELPRVGNYSKTQCSSFSNFEQRHYDDAFYADLDDDLTLELPKLKKLFS